MQLRRKLETDALDEVFRRGVDALRDGLTKNLVGYGRACLQEDLEEVVRIDLAFHRLIVESADEGSLVAVWLPVISQMFLRYSRHHSLVESYDEHAAILRAIESGDRQGAKQLLREHIV
ncbi:MAG: FCD domain-containing protein [Planctomycetota bacterium]